MEKRKSWNEKKSIKEKFLVQRIKGFGRKAHLILNE
jgi:hypothetical protein